MSEIDGITSEESEVEQEEDAGHDAQKPLAELHERFEQREQRVRAKTHPNLVKEAKLIEQEEAIKRKNGLEEAKAKALGELEDPAVTTINRVKYSLQVTVATAALEDREPDEDVLEAILDISQDTIRNLPAEEYYEYLILLDKMSASRLFAKNSNVIVDRFAADIEEYSEKSYPERYIAHDIGGETRKLLWRLNHTDEKLPKEQIAKLHALIDHPNKVVRHHALEALGYVIRLDARNRKGEQSLNLYDNCRQEIIQKLVHPEHDYDMETAFHLVDVYWSEFGSEVLEDVFVKAMMQVPDTEAAKRTFSYFSNRISAEQAVRLMQGLTEPTQQDHRDTVMRWIGLLKEKGTLATEQKLYREFNIGEWKPNDELIQLDLQMIKDVGGESNRYLDIGCGTGRHMLSLKAEGKDVTGIDLSKENIQKLHDSDPEAKALVASWHNLPFPEKSFDMIYCLGRSFQHNASDDDIRITLGEIRNALTDDGIVLIDSADPDKGFVGKQKQEFADAVEGLGISYYQEGAMVGSPDAQNFVPRLVETPGAFIATAKLSGFSCEVVGEYNYKDHGGQENTNYYYKLTKNNKQLTPHEIGELLRDANVGSPPMFVTFI